MAQQIKLKRSAVAGRVPTTSSLDLGEIAINTADGKLYFQRGDSTIQSFFTTNTLITGSLQQSGSDSYFLSNVGIGTDAPSTELEVSGTTTVQAVLPSTDSIYNLGSSSNRFLYTYSRYLDSGINTLELRSGATMLFKNGGTERMRIDSAGNVGIGTTSPAYALDVNADNIRVGAHTIGIAGSATTSSLAIGQDALGSYSGIYSNTAIGWKALSLVTGGPNDAIGAESLRYSIDATYNTAIGLAAGYRSQGTQNTFIGQYSGPYYSDVTGGYNTFIGPLVGLFSSGSSQRNTGIGANALYSFTNANSNTALGSTAGFDLTTGGSNTFIGDAAGRGITTGTGNTVIGRISGLSSTLSGVVIIGDGNGNQRIYVDNGGNVGIGTTTPSAKLDVVGDVKITGSLDMSGSINLTGDRREINILGDDGQVALKLNDASSGATDIGSVTWHINGSAYGYIVANGTPGIDGLLMRGNSNRGLTFQTNGANTRMRIQEDGNIGIGTTSPTERLTVEGNISASGDLYLDGAIFDSSDTSGSLGQVLTSIAGGTAWEDIDTAVLDEVENIYATVKNVSGGTLFKGTPVHAVSGSSSGQVNPVIAASASDATTMPATFILNQDINDEAEGQAIIAGHIEGVDTSLFNVGDIVYVGESGGYTNVKPTGSANLIQNLGVVTKVHASNGSGVIYGSGRSNDVPNLPVGKIWVGSDSYSVTSSLVHLDETNGRLGIGTTSPSQPLHVNGNGRFGGDIYINGQILRSDSTGTKIGFDNNIIRLHTNTSERMRIDSSGNVGIGTTNPPYKLTVQGNAYVYGGNLNIPNGTYGIVNAGNISQKLYFPSLGNFAFENINVGIGTTSPSEKLTVEGNISASGDLITESDLLVGYPTNLGRKVTIVDAGTDQEGIHIRTGQPTIELQDWNTGDKAVITSDVGNITLQADVNANRASSNISLEVDSVQRLRVDENGVQITGSINHDGDLTVTGIVTAQEFHTEFVSASIIYQSGSTKFGDTSDDVHEFTGSLSILSGSATINAANSNVLYVNNSANSTATIVSTNQYLSLNPASYIVLGKTALSYEGIWTSNNKAHRYRETDGTWVDILNLSGTDNVLKFGTVGDVSTGGDIAFYTSGSEKVRITDDGNLAINATSTSGYKLYVNGNTYLNGSTNYFDGQTILRTASGVTEVMRVASNGNVGIGTSSPSYKLTVGDSSGGDGTTTGIAGFYGQHASSPGLLQINYDTDGSGETSVKFGGNGMIAGRGGIFNFNTSGRDISFAVNNEGNANVSNAALYISSSGDAIFQNNVGIGTTSPSEKLEVVGSVLVEGNSDSRLYLGSNIGQKFSLGTVYDGTYDSMFIEYSALGVPKILTLRGNGNVGIGTTTPSVKLHISDTTAPSFRLSRTGTGQIWEQGIDSSGRFQLKEAASEGGTQYTRFQVDDTGEVQFGAYGSGTITGTAAYTLAVDSSGNIIEVDTSNINAGENTDVDTGTEVVDTFSSGSGASAFTNYVVNDGTNYRAGQLMTVWNTAGSIEYTDVSTNSIGDTSEVFIFAAVNGADIEIKATVPSDNWVVRVNSTLL